MVLSKQITECAEAALAVPRMAAMGWRGSGAGDDKEHSYKLSILSYNVARPVRGERQRSLCGMVCSSMSIEWPEPLTVLHGFARHCPLNGRNH